MEMELELILVALAAAGIEILAVVLMLEKAEEGIGEQHIREFLLELTIYMIFLWEAPVVIMVEEESLLKRKIL